jgi:hypothetical protein
MMPPTVRQAPIFRAPVLRADAKDLCPSVILIEESTLLFSFSTLDTGEHVRYCGALIAQFDYDAPLLENAVGDRTRLCRHGRLP